MTATVTVDLDAFTGAALDSVVTYQSITFDPHIDYVHGTEVAVGRVTVNLGQQVVAGVLVPFPVTLLAGVTYAVTCGLFVGGTYTVGPLTDGASVNLSSVIVPGTPITPSQASSLSARVTVLESNPVSAPDATTTTKGIIELAGDLAGTAAAPVVAKVNGVAVTGTPTAGQVPTASSGTAAAWATPSGGGAVSSVAGRTGAVVLGESDIANLTTDLAAKTTTAQAAAAAPVQSVAGRTGAVVLAESDVTSLVADLAAKATPANITTAVATETTRATIAEGLAAQKASNLSDLANAATARTNLGLGTAATTASTTYATAAQGTDARTPTAHAATHKSGGSDAIKLNELAAPTAAVALGAQKITGLANGTVATDGAAFGQIPTTAAAIGGADISGQFAVNTVATSGSAVTIPVTYPAHNVTLSANCTFTFTSPTAGHAFVLRLSGAFTPTFPGTVKWPGGTAPTYASAGTLYQFVTMTAGATWIGNGTAFA